MDIDCIVQKMVKTIKDNILLTKGVYAILENPIYSAFFFVFTGKSAVFPSWKAKQSAWTGQMPQEGFLGLQMFAPRSIIAWLKSPKSLSGIIKRANSKK